MPYSAPAYTCHHYLQTFCENRTDGLAAGLTCLSACHHTHTGYTLSIKPYLVAEEDFAWNGRFYTPTRIPLCLVSLLCVCGPWAFPLLPYTCSLKTFHCSFYLLALTGGLDRRRLLGGRRRSSRLEEWPLYTHRFYTPIYALYGRWGSPVSPCLPLSDVSLPCSSLSSITAQTDGSVSMKEKLGSRLS